VTATDGHDANAIGLMSLPINMTGAKKRVTVESGWRAEDSCLKRLSSGVRPVVATFILVVGVSLVRRIATRRIAARRALFE
jgi:hypothetical protein